MKPTHLLLAIAVPTLVISSEVSCSLKHKSDGTPPFDDKAMSKILEYWLANINVEDKGAILAAPDPHAEADCPGLDNQNNYEYHWARDSALTMHALMFTAEMSPSDKARYFRKYVEWEKKIHQQPDAHPGLNILAEPKFFLNGSALYPWYSTCMRPQNDGPALRAKVISEVAVNSRYKGSPLEEDLDLFEFVARDLNYLVETWQNPTCEPWEEVRTPNAFFDRYVMRAGLIKGARFAKDMGKLDDAKRWEKEAETIEKTLHEHYNTTGKFVYEDVTLEKSHRDAAVIEAFNDGYLGDDVFPPLSNEVLTTVIAYNALFCNEYEINQKDTLAGIPGILYGRYTHDTYCAGNPWVLLSAALAELVYSTASELLKVGSVSAKTYDLLQQAYGIESELQGKELADAVFGAADGIMLRIKYHVEGDDYHMNEQISRYDGHQLSAHDLTWSYSNVIKAMHARKLYMEATEAHMQLIEDRTWTPLIIGSSLISAVLLALAVLGRRASHPSMKSTNYALLADAA